MEMNSFQEELKKGVTLMDFNAPWCAPCRAQEPVIKKLTSLYRDRAAIIEINIDEHQLLATEFGVQSIPTLIIFKEGKEMKRFVGLQTEEAIAENLDNLL
nr:thioredoxin fold domain-containing protein [Desulfobacula sp.]